jgi:hypothetical protein
LDPLIKSQLILLIYQAHFDISSIRSGIEPERKPEIVERITSFNPAAERMRRHRRRRRNGLRCLTVQLRETEVETLVRRDYCKRKCVTIPMQ